MRACSPTRVVYGHTQQARRRAGERDRARATGVNLQFAPRAAAARFGAPRARGAGARRPRADTSMSMAMQQAHELGPAAAASGFCH